MTQQRVGIFGGTFDPVHQGHIEVAQHVRSLLSLHRVEFVPAYRSPHKHKPPVANAWHRFAMLTLATTDHEGFSVSTIELERSQPTYTIDTIQGLKQTWKEAALYFIIGADSFEEITTWRNADQLLQSCHFAVMTRPGHTLETAHLPPGARQRMVDLQEGAPVVHESDGYHIYLCGGVLSPVSSTSIRHAIKEDRIVEELNPAVRRYIEKYQLYREADETKTDEANFARIG